MTNPIPPAVASKGGREAPVEFVLMQILMTETGFPAPLNVVDEMYGKKAQPAPTGPGWWWVPCTPLSAASIRERGHFAQGSVTTSKAPPQTHTITFDGEAPDRPVGYR